MISLPPFSHSVHASFRSLNVLNGDFKNTQGLSFNAGWYGGANQAPFNWFTDTIDTGPNSDSYLSQYKVYSFNNTFWANLDGTSNNNPFVPMSQIVGTTTNSSNVTVTFTASNFFSQSSTLFLGSALYDNSSNALLAVFNEQYNNTRISSYTGFNIPANTTVKLSFWQGIQDHPIAITNVSIIS